MLVALKPKPMLPGVADAGAASRSTAAASTAGTSAMTFIFIFQALPSCHRESVADTAGDAAPAAPVRSAAEHQARTSPDGQENADASGPSGGRGGGGPGIGRCTNAASPGNPISCRQPS